MRVPQIELKTDILKDVTVMYILYTLAYKMQQKPTQWYCFKFIKDDDEIV